MAAATIAGPDDNGAWRTTTREPAPESLPNTLTSSQGEVMLIERHWSDALQ